MFPERVELHEKNIAKLTSLYRTAYAQIITELEGASSFGVANRAQLLSQIENIMLGYGSEVSPQLKSEIRKYYTEGADDGILQLQELNVDVPVSTGFNRIHELAIAALIDDTQASFAESLSGVTRNTTITINQAVRDMLSQQMATGKISGSSLRQVKAVLVETLKEQGLTALKSKPWTNKNGTVVQNTWTLDNYVEMLIRTKGVEARNRGLANRIVENNYDLVQVSAHGARDACREWEGKILSVTGDTPGYPTVKQAENGGLFHPNCRHAINVINLQLARLTKAYFPDDPTMSGIEFYRKYYPSL